MVDPRIIHPQFLPGNGWTNSTFSWFMGPACPFGSPAYCFFHGQQSGSSSFYLVSIVIKHGSDEKNIYIPIYRWFSHQNLHFIGGSPLAMFDDLSVFAVSLTLRQQLKRRRSWMAGADMSWCVKDVLGSLINIYDYTQLIDEYVKIGVSLTSWHHVDIMSSWIENIVTY